MIGTKGATLHPDVELATKENFRRGTLFFAFPGEVERWMGWYWRSCPWIHVTSLKDIEDYVKQYRNLPADYDNRGG